MENSCEYAGKYSNDVTLKELKDRLAEFAEARGWDQYHSPRNLLLALVSPLITIHACMYVYFNTKASYMCAGGRGWRALRDIPVERRGCKRAARLEL